MRKKDGEGPESKNEGEQKAKWRQCGLLVRSHDWEALDLGSIPGYDTDSLCGLLGHFINQFFSYCHL